MKNYIQNGKHLDVLASKAYASGDIVVEGQLVGVATTDIPNGELGAVSTEGVYAFTKKTATTVAVGDVVHWDATAGKLDKGASTPKVGHAVLVEGDTVHVKFYGFLLA
jgi:predicted RecA/RadA family phage recombinase